MAGVSVDVTYATDFGLWSSVLWPNFESAIWTTQDGKMRNDQWLKNNDINIINIIQNIHVLWRYSSSFMCEGGLVLIN